MSLAFPSEITAYMDLMGRRPDLFPMWERLVVDPGKMTEYSRSSDRPVGLVYSSPWHYLIVDVVADADGNPSYAHERFVSQGLHAGGVAIPILPDGRICLLENYRHTLGKVVLELPRGAASGTETGEQAAVRELAEELGAGSVSCRVLGEVVADSGVNGDVVTIARIDISDTKVNIGHEGITGYRAMTLEELERAIAEGAVLDGFTLAAVAILESRNDDA